MSSEHREIGRLTRIIQGVQWRVGHFGKLLGNSVRRLRPGEQDSTQAWSEGLSDEIDFWRTWIESGGGSWAEVYNGRLAPSSRLQEHIARYIAVPEHAPAMVLDVGAGPLTSVGKTHPEFELSVVAVDALADVYNELLDAAEIEPPVRTRQCETERLTELFDFEAFDVVHARNTLDHSYDPLRAIREMARVTKRGGAVILQHCPNEAKHMAYQGLHRWNLATTTTGRFTISRPKRPWGTESHDVAVELADILELLSIGKEHDEPDMDLVVFRRRVD